MFLRPGACISVWAFLNSSSNGLEVAPPAALMRAIKAGVDSELRLILTGLLCGAFIASPPSTGIALSISTVVLFRATRKGTSLSRKPVLQAWLAALSAVSLFDK